MRKPLVVALLGAGRRTWAARGTAGAHALRGRGRVPFDSTMKPSDRERPEGRLKTKPAGHRPAGPDLAYAIDRVDQPPLSRLSMNAVSASSSVTSRLASVAAAVPGYLSTISLSLR